jgi:hypothetical protein
MIVKDPGGFIIAKKSLMIAAIIGFVLIACALSGCTNSQNTTTPQATAVPADGTYELHVSYLNNWEVDISQ